MTSELSRPARRALDAYQRMCDAKVALMRAEQAWQLALNDTITSERPELARRCAASHEVQVNLPDRFRREVSPAVVVLLDASLSLMVQVHGARGDLPNGDDVIRAIGDARVYRATVEDGCPAPIPGAQP